jgi:hypothetical protein
MAPQLLPQGKRRHSWMQDTAGTQHIMMGSPVTHDTLRASQLHLLLRLPPPPSPFLFKTLQAGCASHLRRHGDAPSKGERARAQAARWRVVQLHHGLLQRGGRVLQEGKQRGPARPGARQRVLKGDCMEARWRMTEGGRGGVFVWGGRGRGLQSNWAHRDNTVSPCPTSSQRKCVGGGGEQSSAAPHRPQPHSLRVRHAGPGLRLAKHPRCC